MIISESAALLQTHCRPYHPDTFVQRQGMRWISESIAQASHGDFLKEPIISIYGPPLTGKTFELKNLTRTFGYDGVKRTVTAYHAAAENEATVTHAVQQVSADVLRQLGDSGSVEDKQALQLATEKGDASHLARGLGGLKGKGLQTVVLLDNMNSIKDEELLRFEQDVFPLSFDQRAVLVMAGLRPRHFRSFEIRRRLDYSNSFMMPLGPAEVAEQFERQQVANSRATYRYTAGSPLLTQAMVDREIAPQLQGTSAQSQEVLASSGFGEVLGAYEKEIMKHVPDRLHGAFQAAATYTHYRLEQLIDFMPQINSYLRDRPVGYYLSESLDLYRQTPYVHWNRELRGYQVDHTVRRVIDLSNELNRPDALRQRHAIAANITTGYIKEYPIPNVPDWYHDLAFHTMQRERGSGSGEAGMHGEVMNVFGQAERRMDTESMLELKKMMADDTDLQYGLPAKTLAAIRG